MDTLVRYFTEGVKSHTLETVGMEIETQYVDEDGSPIHTHVSQRILNHLVQKGWEVLSRKGLLSTVLRDKEGNKIFYELGRHNIEVATAPSTATKVLSVGQRCLTQIYEAGRLCGAKPYFNPILEGDEDLLVIPDERDATWLTLDGRDALAPLARTSSVQFTVSVAPHEAIGFLNTLGERLGTFMLDYPQDRIWKQYIKSSSAGYLSERYGGPSMFTSIEDYCAKLALHDVVHGELLIPIAEVVALDIPLYLRSIWWHFRLKRYGDTLCIEVRPIARREDTLFQHQLKAVLLLFGY